MRVLACGSLPLNFLLLNVRDVELVEPAVDVPNWASRLESCKLDGGSAGCSWDVIVFCNDGFLDLVEEGDMLHRAHGIGAGDAVQVNRLHHGHFEHERSELVDQAAKEEAWMICAHLVGCIYACLFERIVESCR